MLTLNSILGGLAEDQMDLIIGSDIQAGGGSTSSHKTTKTTKTTKKTTRTTRKFCS